MTTEQKKAIKSLDEFVNTKYGAFSVNEGRQILNLIKEQEREIEKYNKLYQKALNDAVVTAQDNMQKDKIIDLMSEFVDTELSSQRLGIVLNQKVDPLQSYKKDIKQYFERKVE